MGVGVGPDQPEGAVVPPAAAATNSVGCRGLGFRGFLKINTVYFLHGGFRLQEN